MMRATHFMAPCGVRVAGSSIAYIYIACAGKTSYLRVIFPDLRVYDIKLFSHISATKMMFWALARVSFRAAKIVSCNKKKKINGLRSKLPQLFYFTNAQCSKLLHSAIAIYMYRHRD
jgi:hypothetical protein